MKAWNYAIASLDKPSPTRSWMIPNAAFVLIGSNMFMTTAWYGHLRFKEVRFLE
jgi:uncharacterized protein (DUF486 family)